MSIALNPVFPVIAKQGVAADAVLQPGTTIDARVLKLLENDFVRIAIASLTIEVLSEVPLNTGQTLKLAVSQTTNGVRLQIVPQGGANANASATSVSLSTTASSILAAEIADAPGIAADQPKPVTSRALTNLEALVVSAAVQAAATKQGSLGPLFADASVAASAEALPPALQQAAAQLLAVRPQLANLSGDALKAAFARSGLFFEQSLASVGPTGSPQNSPDLKAALIVFRQTVASWLGDANTNTQGQAAASQTGSEAYSQAASSAARLVITSAGLNAQIEVDEILLPQASLPVAEEPGDAEARVKIFSPSDVLPTAAARAAASTAGLTSLQELLQGFPKGVRDAVISLLDAEGSSRAHTALGDNPPPPFRGGATSAQPIASPSIAPDTPPTNAAHRLIEDADAAISRLTLLQVASLPDRVDIQAARNDTNVPRWNFEIPFATHQGTAVAQFEISRDGEENEAISAQRIWRARFSLDVEPAGPVHALVTLSGERTSVRMWAERPATAMQLRANLSQLGHALREAALEPGDIVIGEGAPPQTTRPDAGHFLDRAL